MLSKTYTRMFPVHISSSLKISSKSVEIFLIFYRHINTGWAKKTGPFLRVYNFATVGARNACDMSKFSNFYPEKNIKLACHCV